MTKQNAVLDRRSFLSLLGAGSISLVLAACGGASEAPAAEDSTAADTTETTDTAEAADTTEAADTGDEASQQTETSAAGASSAAVVYFSWSGNTRSMAERIAELSGATVFELVPETPYPEEYNACTDEALAEQQEGTLRPYVGDIEGWDSIDTVFIGYPIWWMDLPQITKAFVANHDWAGKTVVPFCSWFSSGWTGTAETLAETCTGATMVEGVGLSQGSLPGSLDEINDWYANLELA